MLAVHLAFGLAPHIGHRTDSICFKVSFAGFTAIVFTMVVLRDGQSCSGDLEWFQNRNRASPTRLFCVFQRNYLMDRNK